MDYKETHEPNIRGIRIVRDTERSFHCIVSLDTHEGEKNSKIEAIGLVYAKALLAGCSGYTREEFQNAVSLLGATITVGIDRGIVSITLTAIDAHMHKLLSLFEAMLLKPTFEHHELKRIIDLLENELNEEQEDAKSQSLYLLIDSLYDKKDRRYISKTAEIVEAVKTVTRKDLQVFHALATKSNWIYTFSSAAAHETRVVTKLKKVRNAFGTRSVLETRDHVKKGSNRKVLLQPIPSKQNIEINFGGLLPLCLTEKEFYAFIFGLNVLGKWGGFAGRLMSTVREKEGLTYGIYARTETTTKTEYGYWRIMTFFAPDKVVQGVNATLREITTIAEQGITANEFARFKNILKTGEALLRDSIRSSVGAAHAYQVKGLSLHEIEEHRKNMLNVRIEEVNDALKKYLNPHTLTIAAAGPVSQKSKELKALQRLAKSEK